MKPPLPSSDVFWVLASGYCDAGDAALSLISSPHYSGFVCFPCAFSYFRCIELALKAVLVHHGVPEFEITRKLGHRISPLMTRVEKVVKLSSLGIHSKDRQFLDRFSEKYSEKWFEYPDDLWKAEARLEELKGLAHRVCDTIRTYECNRL